LYVSAEVVDFRKDALTEAGAAAKIQKMQEHFKALIANPNLLASPILTCELGAKKRGIDMGVAAADAQHWWATGQVPLRPTPMAPARSRKQEAPQKQEVIPAGLDPRREEQIGQLLERCIVHHFEKTGEFISEQKSKQWVRGVAQLDDKKLAKLLSDKKAFAGFVRLLAANPATAWAGV